jgi:hypothetical protein
MTEASGRSRHHPSKRTAAELAACSLSLPQTADDGATVRVEVATKVVYPAGDTRVDVEPICAGDALQEIPPW